MYAVGIQQAESWSDLYGAESWQGAGSGYAPSGVSPPLNLIPGRLPPGRSKIHDTHNCQAMIYASLATAVFLSRLRRRWDDGAEEKKIKTIFRWVLGYLPVVPLDYYSFGANFFIESCMWGSADWVGLIAIIYWTKSICSSFIRVQNFPRRILKISVRPNLTLTPKLDSIQ